jgi:hypothetical protein
MEPVLLELGKSLFVCQAFEGTLVLLLSTISHEDANAEEGAFAAAIDLFSQRTLGNLLKRLRARLDPPKELDTYFTEGWSSRNWIVHEFLHKCIADLQSPKGRLDASTMLVGAKQKVKLADVAANAILDQYLKKYELSVAQLKTNADRMWEYLNPEPSSPPN